MPNDMSGNGIGYVKMEFGIYVVKHKDTERRFPTLSAAKEFYYLIDAPKALFMGLY
jgi:hypothetical protein